MSTISSSSEVEAKLTGVEQIEAHAELAKAREELGLDVPSDMTIDHRSEDKLPSNGTNRRGTDLWMAL